MKHITVCVACGEECETYSNRWTEQTEFWGSIENTPYSEIQSECCNNDVEEEVEENQ
jgi:hypothetical protein